MIAAFDVHYSGQQAMSAGIVFENWDDSKPVREYLVQLENIADYIPGRFYLRELPCITAVLEKMEDPPHVIVIDGYVTLGRDEKPGLGGHLSRVLKHGIPIIGVAKSEYSGIPESAAIYRGKSRKPLYITCMGIGLEQARQNIIKMHGRHRIPTLLKHVDALSRGGLNA